MTMIDATPRAQVETEFERTHQLVHHTTRDGAIITILTDVYHRDDEEAYAASISLPSFDTEHPVVLPLTTVSHQDTCNERREAMRILDFTDENGRDITIEIHIASFRVSISWGGAEGYRELLLPIDT